MVVRTTGKEVGGVGIDMSVRTDRDLGPDCSVINVPTQSRYHRFDVDQFDAQKCGCARGNLAPKRGFKVENEIYIKLFTGIKSNVMNRYIEPSNRVREVRYNIPGNVERGLAVLTPGYYRIPVTRK